MDYKADNRLPLELLVKCPFVYTGPHSDSFLVGSIQGALNFQGRILKRFYPLTVYEENSRRGIVDRVFCLCLFYVDDEGELVLYLSHPCWLNRSEDALIMDFFEERVEELAKSGGCGWIEVELHDEILSYTAFPTSLTPFSQNLREVSTRGVEKSLVHSRGFREKSEIHCYQQGVDALEEIAEEGYRERSKYTIKSVAGQEFLKARRNTESFPIRPYSLSQSYSFAQYTGRIPQAQAYYAYSRAQWFRRSELAGFIRWSPNLLEASETLRLPVPLVFDYAIQDYPFKYGKIVDWGLRLEDNDLVTLLLSHAFQAMKGKGIELCQIYPVEEEESGMKSILKRYGFRRVHTMKIYRRRVR